MSQPADAAPPAQEPIEPASPEEPEEVRPDYSRGAAPWDDERALLRALKKHYNADRVDVPEALVLHLRNQRTRSVRLDEDDLLRFLYESLEHARYCSNVPEPNGKLPFFSYSLPLGSRSEIPLAFTLTGVVNDGDFRDEELTREMVLSIGSLVANPADLVVLPFCACTVGGTEQRRLRQVRLAFFCANLSLRNWSETSLYADALEHVKLAWKARGPREAGSHLWEQWNNSLRIGPSAQMPYLPVPLFGWVDWVPSGTMVTGARNQCEVNQNVLAPLWLVSEVQHSVSHNCRKPKFYRNLAPNALVNGYHITGAAPDFAAKAFAELGSKPTVAELNAAKTTAETIMGPGLASVRKFLDLYTKPTNPATNLLPLHEAFQLGSLQTCTILDGLDLHGSAAFSRTHELLRARAIGAEVLLGAERDLSAFQYYQESKFSPVEPCPAMPSPELHTAVLKAWKLDWENYQTLQNPGDYFKMPGKERRKLPFPGEIRYAEVARLVRDHVALLTTAQGTKVLIRAKDRYNFPVIKILSSASASLYGYLPVKLNTIVEDKPGLYCLREQPVLKAYLSGNLGGPPRTLDSEVKEPWPTHPLEPGSHIPAGKNPVESHILNTFSGMRCAFFGSEIKTELVRVMKMDDPAMWAEKGHQLNDLFALLVYEHCLLSGGDDNFFTLLQYYWASACQFPDSGARQLIPIVAGAHGTFKSALVNFRGEFLVGFQCRVTINNVDHGFQYYNSAPAQKIFTLIEEGQVNSKSYAQIKAYATEDFVGVRRMYSDVEVARIHGRLFVINNYVDEPITSMEIGDRRQLHAKPRSFAAHEMKEKTEVALDVKRLTTFDDDFPVADDQPAPVAKVGERIPTPCAIQLAAFCLYGLDVTPYNKGSRPLGHQPPPPSVVATKRLASSLHRNEPAVFALLRALTRRSNYSNASKPPRDAQSDWENQLARDESGGAPFWATSLTPKELQQGLDIGFEQTSKVSDAVQKVFNQCVVIGGRIQLPAYEVAVKRALQGPPQIALLLLDMIDKNQRPEKDASTAFTVSLKHSQEAVINILRKMGFRGSGTTLLPEEEYENVLEEPNYAAAVDLAYFALTGKDFGTNALLEPNCQLVEQTKRMVADTIYPIYISTEEAVEARLREMDLAAQMRAPPPPPPGPMTEEERAHLQRAAGLGVVLPGAPAPAPPAPPIAVAKKSAAQQKRTAAEVRREEEIRRIMGRQTLDPFLRHAPAPTPPTPRPPPRMPTAFDEEGEEEALDMLGENKKRDKARRREEREAEAEEASGEEDGEDEEKEVEKPDESDEGFLEELSASELFKFNEETRGWREARRGAWEADEEEMLAMQEAAKERAAEYERDEFLASDNEVEEEDASSSSNAAPLMPKPRKKMRRHPQAADEEMPDFAANLDEVMIDAPSV